jgi:hypothetical protein
LDIVRDRFDDDVDISIERIEEQTVARVSRILTVDQGGT